MNNKPVAYMVNNEVYTDIFEAEHYQRFTNKPRIPLYTYPHSEESVKVKELTDEEILEVAVEAWGSGHEIFWFDDDGINLFARAILRKAQENEMDRNSPLSDWYSLNQP